MELTVFNLDFYSHSGPMARSVADIALMQNIISGPHNQDIASLRDRVSIDTRSVKKPGQQQNRLLDGSRLHGS